MTVRKDITELVMKPAGGRLKMGVTVQLNLFAQSRRGRMDLIPANMATWASTDNRVGEVNSQGRLTPRGAGSVTVAATYADKKVLAIFDVVD